MSRRPVRGAAAVAAALLLPGSSCDDSGMYDPPPSPSSGQSDTVTPGHSPVRPGS